LQAVFDALPDGPIVSAAQQSVAPEPVVRRLGNGVVQRAVVKVLAASDVPVRLAAIHAAVEAVLGQAVSKESVCWCLRTGCGGDKPRFERALYGYYRLVRP
jgi:hypothetical protein